MLSEENKVLDKIEKILASCPYNVTLYEEILQELNPIVVRTAEDDEYRGQMANEFAIWKQLKISMNGCVMEKMLQMGNEDHIFWYLRTVRGLIVLMRNLAVSNYQIPEELSMGVAVIELFTKLSKFKFKYDDMETSTFISICSFLYNMTKESITFEFQSLDSLMVFLQYPISHSQKRAEILFPYLAYFDNLARNDDFLYYFLRSEYAQGIIYDFFVVEVIHDYSTISKFLKNTETSKIDDNDTEKESQLTPIDTTLIRLFTTLARNESFCTFIAKLEEKDIKMSNDLLRVMQLIITSSDRWDKYGITTVMSWCFDLFNNAMKKCEFYFEDGVEDENKANLIHRELYGTLDIILSLSKFEHTLEFLNHYRGIEKLIKLLNLLQEKLIRVNFTKDQSGKVTKVKTTTAIGGDISNDDLVSHRVDSVNKVILATNFPEIKSLTIELIANLAHKNQINQDKVRELQGLGTVLSNCVIDDNDPFIKERSIICIRFLLENNPENQKIVQDLEAKGSVKSDVLDEAGYEVKIDKGGEIGLTPKNKET